MRWRCFCIVKELDPLNVRSYFYRDSKFQFSVCFSRQILGFPQLSAWKIAEGSFSVDTDPELCIEATSSAIIQSPSVNSDFTWATKPCCKYKSPRFFPLWFITETFWLCFAGGSICEKKFLYKKERRSGCTVIIFVLRDSIKWWAL